MSSWSRVNEKELHKFFMLGHELCYQLRAWLEAALGSRAWKGAGTERRT